MIWARLSASGGREKKATAFYEKNGAKKREKNFFFCVQKRWAMVLCFCSSTKRTIVLPICQDDNLVGNRIDVLFKVSIILSK